MKTILVTFVTALTALCASSDSVTITSTPPGATVSWNRKAIGVTPLSYRVGEYAFNAHKSSLMSKRLSQPVILHVELAGFEAKDVNITQEMTWHSFNGQNSYVYYIIPVQTFDFKLDKVSAVPKTMSNDDVVKLWNAGFGDDLVIQKINSTATAFTLEIEDLVQLRKAGVSDAIIQAMMQKSTKP